MLFNSVQFLLFFPVVCLLYYVIPNKGRNLFLLACSYFFYMCWNAKYAVLLLAVTIITYVSGLLINSANQIEDEKKRTTRKNLCVAASFVLCLAFLFVFKYLDLAVTTFTRLCSVIGIQITAPEFDIVLPVGISFYIFQALTYTMDLYRGEVAVEKNFLKYALFVSFFPQLLSGPIQRSKHFLSQLEERHTFDWDNTRYGLLLMLFGYFQKVLIADNISTIVNNVYGVYQTATGFQLTVAAFLFGIQIYCDFAGYSNIAIGAAKIMGFRLSENFDTPYFSQSTGEFWRRWHISLSSWFRDYLYIPLGGNRKGNLRKQVNLMIVFLISGLWHGAAWHFVVWGGLNGLYQVIGSYLKPVRKKVKSWLHVDETSASHKLLRMLLTFVLIDIAWIFFKMGFRQSLTIIAKIFFLKGNWLSFGDNYTVMGINIRNVIVLTFSIGALLAADVCRYHKIDLIGWILKQQIWLRWVIYYAVIFAILICGVYGSGCDASQFIYLQF